MTIIKSATTKQIPKIVLEKTSGKEIKCSLCGKEFNEISICDIQCDKKDCPLRLTNRNNDRKNNNHNKQ